MEQVGATARHRALTLYSPAGMYIRGCLLLIFTDGMAVAGCWEAHLIHRHGWAIFFLVAVVLTTMIYFWMVACSFPWIPWITRSDEGM